MTSDTAIILFCWWLILLISISSLVLIIFIVNFWYRIKDYFSKRRERKLLKNGIPVHITFMNHDGRTANFTRVIPFTTDEQLIKEALKNEKDLIALVEED